MRQIKFRAWDDEAKKMYSAEELEQSEVNNPMEKTIYSYLSFGILCIYDFRREEPVELMPLQFTGWLDRNNVEIYEGDLILFQGHRYQIIWSEEISAFMLLSDQGSALLGGEHLTGEVEVIGNVFAASADHLGEANANHLAEANAGHLDEAEIGNPGEPGIGNVFEPGEKRA